MCNGPQKSKRYDGTRKLVTPIKLAVMHWTLVGWTRWSTACLFWKCFHCWIVLCSSEENYQVSSCFTASQAIVKLSLKMKPQKKWNTGRWVGVTSKVTGHISFSLGFQSLLGESFSVLCLRHFSQLAVSVSYQTLKAVFSLDRFSLVEILPPFRVWWSKKDSIYNKLPTCNQ